METGERWRPLGRSWSCQDERLALPQLESRAHSCREGSSFACLSTSPSAGSQGAAPSQGPKGGWSALDGRAVFNPLKPRVQSSAPGSIGLLSTAGHRAGSGSPAWALPGVRDGSGSGEAGRSPATGVTTASSVTACGARASGEPPSPTLTSPSCRIQSDFTLT